MRYLETIVLVTISLVGTSSKDSTAACTKLTSVEQMRDVVRLYFRRVYAQHDFSVWPEVFDDGLKMRSLGVALRDSESMAAVVRSQVSAHLPTDKYQLQWLEASLHYSAEEHTGKPAGILKFSFSAELEYPSNGGVVAKEHTGVIVNTWRFGANCKVINAELTLPSDSNVAQSWRADILAAAANEVYFESQSSPKSPLRMDPASVGATEGPGFFDRSPFDSWATAVESQVDTILSEFRKLPQIDPVVVFKVGSKQYNKDRHWRKFVLYFAGVRLEDHCSQTPMTCALLATIPGLIGAEFMVLDPSATLPLHNNAVYVDFVRAHMGLIVPPNCALQVLNEIRPWQEGKFLFFDDTVAHKVWNRSDRKRVILSLDILRPELMQQGYTVTSSVVEQFKANKRRLTRKGKFEFVLNQHGKFSIRLPLANNTIALREECEGPEVLPGLSSTLFWTVFSSFYPKYRPQCDGGISTPHMRAQKKGRRSAHAHAEL